MNALRVTLTNTSNEFLAPHLPLTGYLTVIETSILGRVLVATFEADTVKNGVAISLAPVEVKDAAFTYNGPDVEMKPYVPTLKPEFVLNVDPAKPADANRAANHIGHGAQVTYGDTLLTLVDKTVEATPGGYDLYEVKWEGKTGTEIVRTPSRQVVETFAEAYAMGQAETMARVTGSVAGKFLADERDPVTGDLVTVFKATWVRA